MIYRSSFKSTKWQLTVLVVLVTTGLTYIGRLNGAEWVTTTTIISLAYMAGNIVSATLNGFTIQSYIGSTRNPHGQTNNEKS